ncbi:MAG: NTP transferase domain-containing protein [Desulfovibrio sp.]|jgi:D-glycero-alpha-D-manno-heptose 1-phosphate guanylyltransferase|nr:NTP transferase domain-containing protein [Desulfovibrio sp.]
MLVSAPLPQQAIILAGGLGTRLRAVVPDRPKPMAPVGGRPFLELLMDYLLGQGIRHFILSTGWKADCITKHFGDTYRGAAVDYVREGEPLGTGGAPALVLKRMPELGDRALLLNGDTWLTFSLPQLVADAADRLPVTMVLVALAAAGRYGEVETDGQGRVRRFGPRVSSAEFCTDKNTGPTLINAGCCLVEIDALRRILQDFPPRFSLEQDLFVPLAERGLLRCSIQKEAEFLDIGVPDDYRRFCATHGAE